MAGNHQIKTELPQQPPPTLPPPRLIVNVALNYAKHRKGERGAEGRDLDCARQV